MLLHVILIYVDLIQLSYILPFQIQAARQVLLFMLLHVIYHIC
jgi:hypothetical protein